MTQHVPEEIAEQVSRARSLLEFHLGPMIEGIYLFGSAVDGGLKPTSDIDLLVTVSRSPDEPVRRALLLDLLTASAPPGSPGTLRPLEVTVLARAEVVPWRYPPRRELQFGEWLRADIVEGVFEPPVLDHDLAILLTKARQRSVTVVGPPAAEFFEPVPHRHFVQALADTLALWKRPEDWQGDERNVVLTLARIVYSAATGRIAAKDAAAAWVLERLPREHRSVVQEAKDAYVSGAVDRLAQRPAETTAFVHYTKAWIRGLLG